ncbi:MAG: PPC domain-containing protein [Desulfobacter sp.]
MKTQKLKWMVVHLLAWIVVLGGWMGMAYAQAPVDFFPDTYAGGSSADQAVLEAVVRQEFNLSDDGPFVRAKVKTHYNGDGAEYLTVYLMSKYTYSFQTARVNLGKGLSVEKTIRDYDVLPEDMDAQTYAACPDTSVDAVFAATDEFASAVDGANLAAQIARGAGYKTVTLIGNAESKAAVQNWLSCPDLKVFGRIGHGSPTGIMLADGVLYYTYFQGLSSTALSGTTLYFNSCQVHNSPLQPAVVNTGVDKFIGGIQNLLVGPSENVFTCFMDKTIADNQSMTGSLPVCEQANYPYTGHHGISGYGSDYIGGGGSLPGETELTSGSPLSGQSGSSGTWTYYQIDVPQGSSELTISISGGTGDADLYTRAGSKPTLSTKDCAPYLNGNYETCTHQSPWVGTWYVGVYGYSSYSGVTITATHTP